MTYNSGFELGAPVNDALVKTRAVVIHGHHFELADKWGVSQQSLERVETLIPRLFFAKINPTQFAIELKEEVNGKNKTNGGNNTVLGDLFKDPNKCVDFLRLLSDTKSIQDIMGAMLTTAKEYYELIALPALVLRELIMESEKEIGAFDEFKETFNLKTSSNPLEMLGNLQADSATL